MPRIEIYTKDACGFCTLAKRLLDSKGADYEEINVSRHPERLPEMVERSGGGMTAPQVFLDGRLLGGWRKLSALHEAGALDHMLREDPGRSA